MVFLEITMSLIATLESTTNALPLQCMGKIDCINEGWSNDKLYHCTMLEQKARAG